MITSQAESPQRLEWAIDAGGLCWDPKAARYVKSIKKGQRGIFRSPHIVGITRELERGRAGSWVGTLFDYQPPRFYFSASEQRMLMRCMSNNTGTNSALARDLNLSLPTVKKMWLSIYGRVATSVPGWMAEDSDPPPIADAARKKGASSSLIFRTTLKLVRTAPLQRPEAPPNFFHFASLKLQTTAATYAFTEMPSFRAVRSSLRNQNATSFNVAPRNNC